MSPGKPLGFVVLLAVLGAGWGATIPLTKIAVSTGFGHFGLIFWQMAIGSVLTAAIALLSGRRLTITRAGLRVFALVALIGTLIPNTLSYQAAVHVPAGIMALMLSMIPMFAFPVALILGLDHFSWRRFGGLCAGLLGVLIIVTPGVSTALATPVFWMLIALAGGLCYAVEGNMVAKWGTAGMDPVQVLLGASVLGAVAVLPVTFASGQFIPPQALLGQAGQAFVLASLIHTLVYVGYVWLVGRAGPVFAVQVSYLVTGFGIFWSKLFLNEAYPPGVWAALAFMFGGLYLVQPRVTRPLAPAPAISDTTR